MGLDEVESGATEGVIEKLEEDEAADGSARVGVKPDTGVETDLTIEVDDDDEVEVEVEVKVEPAGADRVTELPAILDEMTVEIVAFGKARVTATCSSDTSASPSWTPPRYRIALAYLFRTPRSSF